jgi:hypothetical protein
MDSLRTSEGQEKEEGLTNAETTQERNAEAVPQLRKHDDPAEVQRGTGIESGIQPEALLQPALHGGLDGGADQSSKRQDFSPAVTENRGAVLREMPEHASAGCPPQGWQSDEQLARQLTDLVRRLSHAYTLAVVEGDHQTCENLRRVFPACAKAGPVQYTLQSVPQTWRPPTREEVERAWRAGLLAGAVILPASPLCGKLEGRAAMLRGFGNSIVPPLAAEFIRAAMAAEKEEPA